MVNTVATVQARTVPWQQESMLTTACCRLPIRVAAAPETEHVNRTQASYLSWFTNPRESRYCRAKYNLVGLLFSC